MLLGRKAIGTVAYMGGLPAVLEKFTWSWGQMVQFNAEMLCEGTKYVHYMRTAISDHAPARNNLVSKFLGDWLVLFDTDHEFDPDIVTRLVRLADAYDVDVLSGVYQMKNSPHVPVLFQWVKIAEDSDELGLQPMVKWDKRAQLMQIGSAGAGCLFIRRKVFDALATAFPKEGAFDKIHPFSEDHSFFIRCRKLKIKAYAAMNVHCNHLRVVPVTLDDLNYDELHIGELFQVGAY